MTPTRTDSPSEPESLVYEFSVGTGLQGSNVTKEVDLIAEGWWSGTVVEWDALPWEMRGPLLCNILSDFERDSIESGWERVNG